jgi:hypothetical protein
VADAVEVAAVDADGVGEGLLDDVVGGHPGMQVHGLFSGETRWLHFRLKLIVGI